VVSEASVDAARARSRGVGRRRGASRGPRPSWWFVAPALAFLAVLGVYPLYELVRMSVSDVSAATLLSSWPFAGFDNFEDVIASPDFRATCVHTAEFAAIVIGVGLAGGLGAAVALRRRSRGDNFTIALMTLMWALPPIVSGTIWKFLLTGDGVINQIGVSLGLLSEPIQFLQDGQLPLLAVSFVAAWVAVPFVAISYRAALLDVPEELYDAAALDGAGFTKQFRYVTLPHLRRTTLVVAILLLIYSIRSFDFIFVLTNGGPGTASTTVPFLGYQLAFQNFAYDRGAAVAVLAMGLVLIIAIAYISAVRREDRDARR